MFGNYKVRPYYGHRMAIFAESIISLQVCRHYFTTNACFRTLILYCCVLLLLCLLFLSLLLLLPVAFAMFVVNALFVALQFPPLSLYVIPLTISPVSTNETHTNCKITTTTATTPTTKSTPTTQSTSTTTQLSAPS